MEYLNIAESNITESMNLSSNKGPHPEENRSSSTFDSEHHLDEYLISYKTEKENLDTYSHRLEHPKKQIEVKNYKISNGEFVKSFVKDLSEKVVHNSESTLEAKVKTYEEDLDYFLRGKNIANEMIKTNVDNAILEYNKLIREIDDLAREFREEMYDDRIIQEIFTQRKLILSNLSLAYSKKHMYKESIEIDRTIISMDPKFDKSYARLINSCLETDNIHNANFYANMMKTNFNESTLSKYADILKKLEEGNKKADEVFYKFLNI
jgi:tetratricopeptide (TPR) repeat protein